MKPIASEIRAFAILICLFLGSGFQTAHAEPPGPAPVDMMKIHNANDRLLAIYDYLAAPLPEERRQHDSIGVLLTTALAIIHTEYVYEIDANRVADSGIRAMQLFIEARGEADSVSLFEAAVRGMVAILDEHTEYISIVEDREMRRHDPGIVTDIGAVLATVDGHTTIMHVWPGGAAAAAGLKTGDVIVSMDGIATEGVGHDPVARALRASPGKNVVLEVRREGRPGTEALEVHREEVFLQATIARRIDDVVYIGLHNFNLRTREALERAIVAAGGLTRESVQGLVLDLRGNGGGLLQQGAQVASAFIDEGRLVTSHDRRQRRGQTMSAAPGDLAYGKPIVLLIDSGSASAAELVAAALQDNRRATLMGAHSHGKGSVQTIFPLGQLGAMRLTTGLFYRPTGAPIQYAGIEPDILIETPARPGRGIDATRCPMRDGARDHWIACAVLYLEAGGKDAFYASLAGPPEN